MQITEVSVQKNNPKRYNIYIDGAFALSADLENVAQYKLKAGMELDSNRLAKLIEECEYTRAFNHALRMIGTRDYSIHEISSKLERSGYAEQTVLRTVEKLTELKFLDDNRFQQKFYKDGIYLKKHGLRRIEYELKQKGLSKDELDSIRSEEDNETVYQNAFELAEKKLRQLEGKKDVHSKIFRYLSGRGYDYEMIREVLDKLSKNLDNPDFTEEC